jgi:hypothetical protein
VGADGDRRRGSVRYQIGWPVASRHTASRLVSRKWTGPAGWLSQSEIDTAIDVQKARGLLARYETRYFSTTRARHGTD